MNKKGFEISLNFLLTMLLVIIIFGPILFGIFKGCEAMQQSKENFGEFLDFIKDMQDAQQDEKKVQLLIMAENTAVVYFEPEYDAVEVYVGAGNVHSDYVAYFNRPSSCEVNKNCLCLFAKVKSEAEVSTNTVNIEAEEVYCESLSISLSLEDCGIGTPNDVDSYICQNGFTIERKVLDGSSIWVGSFYEAPKRIAIEAKKNPTNIDLRWQH